MKFIKNIIALTCSVLIITACNTEIEPTEEMPLPGFHISTSIKISVIDQNGHDLIDPTIEGHIKASNIQIFHLLDGVKEEYYENMLDAPKGYKIYEPGMLGNNSTYVLSLMATRSEKRLDDVMPITLISWAKNDIDTIQCKIEKVETSTFCTKVWCNNKIVWEIENTDSTGRSFTLIKQR